jgi:hypothetical protein
MKRTPIYPLAVLAALMLGTGCETTSAGPSLKNLEEPFIIQRGTTAEELIAHLGEPSQRQPLEGYSIDAEVWLYERTLHVDSELVIMDTRREMYWDNTSKKIIEYDEPVYEQQNNATVERTELLLVDDHVLKWRRQLDEDRIVAGKAR